MSAPERDDAAIEGGVRFRLEVSIGAAEIATWDVARIDAFFLGIKTALLARDLRATLETLEEERENLGRITADLRARLSSEEPPL